MPTRREQRKRALDVLYQADLRDRDTAAVLSEITAAGEELGPFTVQIVEGLGSERRHVDELIARLARDWTLERMPLVDRNILRIGLYELVCTDVPPAVAINEAVELAKELSTDDSGRYINGILSRAAQQQDRSSEKQ